MSSNPAGWEKPEPFSSASPGKINKKSHFFFFFTHCQLSPICSISHSCGFLLRHLPKAFNTSLSWFSRFALWSLDTIKAFVCSPRHECTTKSYPKSHPAWKQPSTRQTRLPPQCCSETQPASVGRRMIWCPLWICLWTETLFTVLWIYIAIWSRVQMGCVRSKLPDLVPSCGQGLRCGVLNRWSRILQVSLAPGSESCSLQAAHTHTNMSQPESSIKRH